MPKLPPAAGQVNCPRWWSRAAGPNTLARFIVKRMEAGACMGSAVLCFWSEILEWAGFDLPDGILSISLQAEDIASRPERLAFKFRWRMSGVECAKRKQPLWASLDLIAVALASGTPRLLREAVPKQPSPLPAIENPWTTFIAQVKVPHSHQHHSPRPSARASSVLSPIGEASEESSSVSSSALASAVYNRIHAAHEEGEGIGSPSPSKSSPSRNRLQGDYFAQDDASDPDTSALSCSSG